MESSAAFGKVSSFGAALGKERRAPSTSLKLSIMASRKTFNVKYYPLHTYSQSETSIRMRYICIPGNRRLFAQKLIKIDRM